MFEDQQIWQEERIMAAVKRKHLLPTDYSKKNRQLFTT